MPLLYWSIIATNPQSVPENVLTHLRNEFRLNSEHNLLMLRGLLGILEILSKRGIRVTSLKGPALALQAYGDISLRQFADLDILISDKDVETALNLLQKHGYESERLTKRELTTLIKYGYDYPLCNKKLKLMVELHWRISERLIFQGPDANSILDRSERISVLNKNLMFPSPEDMLLLSCQHGTKHAWDKLSFVCDIACLIKSKEINFQKAFQLAQGTMDNRSLVLGLSLVEELFQLPVPQYIQEETRFKESIIKLTNKAFQRILFEKRFSNYSNIHGIGRYIFYINMFERSYEKLLYISRLAICPSEADMKAIILPDILYPMYYFIR
ncbi:MAG: nucleotidyltransferase family protein, partial [Methanotrichaceae archaeon]|nr:nucleotidyltransferase family protein [Methanotrichaceae archaeon]